MCTVIQLNDDQRERVVLFPCLVSLWELSLDLENTVERGVQICDPRSLHLHQILENSAVHVSEQLGLVDSPQLLVQRLDRVRGIHGDVEGWIIFVQYVTQSLPVHTFAGLRHVRKLILPEQKSLSVHRGGKQDRGQEIGQENHVCQSQEIHFLIYIYLNCPPFFLFSSFI